MSQVNETDIVKAHPEIPTNFVANVGTAVPILNTLEILAETVVAGSIPAQTVASGNTVTTQIQLTQAILASDAAKVGLAAFDSTSFAIDANGFVTLIGSSSNLNSIGVDGTSGAGTNPVLPTVGGLVTNNGAVVAAGTNPVRTISTALHVYQTQIQISQATGASDATRIGLCAFDSAAFTVDASGFVTLKGGTLAIDSIGVDATNGTGTNPVLPTVAGLVTNTGAVVAAGTNPVRTVSTAVNTYQTQLQISQALAASDATKIGLSNFNSTHFSVDANGFVSASSGGIFSWVEETTATRALLVNQGVVGNRASAQTFTLPATAAQFSLVRIVQVGAGAITIAQNAGDQIRLGSSATTVGIGGSLTSTGVGNSIELINYVANDTWVVLSSVGTWIIV